VTPNPCPVSPPGTRPEPVGSRRPDPSAIVCRQLGIQLHPLESELPLFDWRGGGGGGEGEGEGQGARKVPEDLDKAVDK
jgi:hypothetical protein